MLTDPFEVTIPEASELSQAVSNGAEEEETWETEDDEGFAPSEEEEIIEDTEEEQIDEDDADEASDEEDDENPDEEEDDSDNKALEDEADEQVRQAVASLQNEADAAAEFLAGHGITYNDLVAEYQEYGKLTKQTIADLAKAGISERLVEGYIQGQQARMDIYASRVQGIAGGEAEYVKLMNWAAKHLSEKEIRHYDKAVESHDIEEARFAVEGLMARRKAAQGEPPKLVRGRTGRSVSSSQVKGVSSLEELANARYEHDAAYTRRVEARMLASNF